MKRLRLLVPALGTFLLAAAMQDPNPPQPTCSGCYAYVDFELPCEFYSQPFPGILREVDWTILNDWHTPGVCADYLGACVVADDCLAFGSAIGTWIGVYGMPVSVTLSAGVNECGAVDYDSEILGSRTPPYISTSGTTYFDHIIASITAHCSTCEWTPQSGSGSTPR